MGGFWTSGNRGNKEHSCCQRPIRNTAKIHVAAGGAGLFGDHTFVPLFPRPPRNRHSPFRKVPPAPVQVSSADKFPVSWKQLQFVIRDVGVWPLGGALPPGGPLSPAAGWSQSSSALLLLHVPSLRIVTFLEWTLGFLQLHVNDIDTRRHWGVSGGGDRRRKRGEEIGSIMAVVSTGGGGGGGERTKKKG